MISGKINSHVRTCIHISLTFSFTVCTPRILAAQIHFNPSLLSLTCSSFTESNQET